MITRHGRFASTTDSAGLRTFPDVRRRGIGIIAQDGREARLMPGDFACYDSTRPYTLNFDSSFEQLVLHMPFGARINRAFGLALRKRFCRSFNFELQAAATDDGVILSLGETHSFPLESVWRFLSPQSVEHWRKWVSSVGAIVCGRTLFDVAAGWNGRHTLDVPVVVVTHRVPVDWIAAHPNAPFSFVSDGVEAAIVRAQEVAGDGVVAVTGGTIARQCLDLGLLDEVAVDLVPVVMGDGNRPFFGRLSSHDVLLGNPTTCIQGDRVTHLVFPVENATARGQT